MTDSNLSWVPLYVLRLRTSQAWKDLKDYQFGWYVKLLVEQVVRGGYLPGSVSELWLIAGAKSSAYFENHGGLELVSRYFTRTDDGTNRIYNPQMHAVLEVQKRKQEAKSPLPPLSFSKRITGFNDLKAKTSEVFAYYIQRLNRKNTYTLTERRAKKFQLRILELMDSQGVGLEEACEIGKQAIDNLAGSEWHVTNGYIDWEEQIFRTQEEFQKRLEAIPRATNAPQKSILDAIR